MAKRSTQWHKEFERKVLFHPEGLAEYKAFQLQLELCEKMKSVRKKARLTQEDVAKKMGTKVPAVARLESSNVSSLHSPSLATLMKYAQAVGRELKIDFVRPHI